jgi:hypothetical protein
MHAAPTIFHRRVPTRLSGTPGMSTAARAEMHRQRTLHGAVVGTIHHPSLLFVCLVASIVVAHHGLAAIVDGDVLDSDALLAATSAFLQRPRPSLRKAAI